MLLYSKNKHPIKYPVINNNANKAPCTVTVVKIVLTSKENYNSLSLLLETRETDYLQFKSRRSKQVERENRATFYDLGNFSRRVFSLVSPRWLAIVAFKARATKLIVTI